MKIYKTIQQAKEDILISLPGIYYFRNKINNKYYIGQALCIRKRFKAHIFNVKNNNNKYPIYKAILKYGEENFEFAIIGVFRKWPNKEILKKHLDKQEIFYIKKYNSYESGYNQTTGGDGGILGYKMTEKQKQHISANSRKVANDGRNNIYIYDLKEEKEYLFTSCAEAGRTLNIDGVGLKNSYSRNLSKSYLNRYILGKTLEELYINVDSYNNRIRCSKSLKIKNSGMFDNKYSLEEYIEFKKENPNLSASELAKLLGVCKKTIYNYEKQLSNPTFKQKEETKYKIINIQTLKEYIVNAKEGGQLFGLTDGQFRKTEKYCRDHSSFYKKKYKIIRLNNL